MAAAVGANSRTMRWNLKPEVRNQGIQGFEFAAHGSESRIITYTVFLGVPVKGVYEGYYKDLGFRVWALGFGVLGLGFGLRVWGSRFRVIDPRIGGAAVVLPPETLP